MTVIMSCPNVYSRVQNCDIHPTLSSLFYCLQLRILFEHRTLAMKHKAKDRKIVIVSCGSVILHRVATLLFKIIIILL